MHQPPIAVTLYTRPGCHLCEDAAEHLETLAEAWPLTVTAVDITRDVELHHRYWARIPVIQIGADVLEAPITLAALTAALRRAGQTANTEG